MEKATMRMIGILLMVVLFLLWLLPNMNIIIGEMSVEGIEMSSTASVSSFARRSMQEGIGTLIS